MSVEAWLNSYKQEFLKYVDYTQGHSKKEINEWVNAEAEYALYFSGLDSDPIEEAIATVDAIHALE